MKFVKAILSFGALHSAVSYCSAQIDDALRDLQIGMQGLKEASNNPALLAQLMQDLQNPEMMAEAKKMMDDPEFQKQMKKFSSSKEFQDSVKKTQEVMNDPNTAAKMEAKLEHMIKRGDNDLKKGAAAAMEEAMASMNNPEVMAEMTKMLKDPTFQAQLTQMAHDPSFRNYMGAMEDMMKDPATKAKLEAASESIRASL